MSGEQLWLYVSAFQLDLDTGRGGTSGQGLTPEIVLQYSDNGGKTWSEELTLTAGKQGAYAWRVIWRRLGKSRDRVWQVTMSDPVPWRVLGAWVTIEPGVS